ncbi:Wzz/FepE/Etk N-terminal domain-containing protein [Sphingomonas aurantiaca]|uniref:Wzz/FepE/Etk N-terminal domain-containing protein n=1 Tax=Sphingomonas aurantiaca TaxID=185949 RepID=UPI002FDFB156
MNRMIEQGVGAADATAPRTMTPHLQERSAPSALAEILSVIRRRRTLIAVIISALLVVGLLFSLLATRKYAASAVLEIQRETGSFVKVEGATSSDNIADQEFYQTQYGLLRLEVARRAGRERSGAVQQHRLPQGGRYRRGR